MAVAKTESLIRKAIFAGMCIGLGCIAYLVVENRYLGAFLFSIGLYTVCACELNLYTGKVCYAFRSGNILDLADDVEQLSIILLCNIIGIMIIAGIAHQSRIGNVIAQKAAEVWAVKRNDSYTSLFCLGILCNMCIYIAVEGFKRNSNDSSKYLSVILGVMVFILIGSEHCVADVFYLCFANPSNDVYGDVFRFLIVILGNTVGGLSCHQLCFKDN